MARFPRAQARGGAAGLRRSDLRRPRPAAGPRRRAPGAGQAFQPRPRRRVPGHRPAPDRDLLAPLRRAAEERRRWTTGRHSRCGRARSSSWATPSRRSIASAVPTSRPTSRAREAFRAQAADGVLSIATNFRSCPPIMEYVNERFEAPLSEENGQPGFQALDPFQPARAAGTVGRRPRHRGGGREWKGIRPAAAGRGGRGRRGHVCATDRQRADSRPRRPAGSARAVPVTSPCWRRPGASSGATRRRWSSAASPLPPKPARASTGARRSRTSSP